MVGFHDGKAYCGDTLEKVESVVMCGAGEGLDEDNAGIGLLVAGVDACNADGHLGVEMRRRSRIEHWETDLSL